MAIVLGEPPGRARHDHYRAWGQGPHRGPYSRVRRLPRRPRRPRGQDQNLRSRGVPPVRFPGSAGAKLSACGGATSTWSGTARRFARPSCPSGTAQPWGNPRPPPGTVGSPRPAHLEALRTHRKGQLEQRLLVGPAYKITGSSSPAPTAIVPLRRTSPWHPADTRLVRSEARCASITGAAERCLIWLGHAARWRVAFPSLVKKSRDAGSW